jgi:hypothetical protein
MDDSKQGDLNQQIRKEEEKTLEDNPIFQALANILEKQETVGACQLMSELYSLAEKERAAEDK